MPVEISQLIVRATVREEPSSTAQQGRSGAAGGNQRPAASPRINSSGNAQPSVEEVISDILKRQQER